MRGKEISDGNGESFDDLFGDLDVYKMPLNIPGMDAQEAFYQHLLKFLMEKNVFGNPEGLAGESADNTLEALINNLVVDGFTDNSINYFCIAIEVIGVKQLNILKEFLGKIIEREDVSNKKCFYQWIVNLIDMVINVRMGKGLGGTDLKDGEGTIADETMKDI